MSTIHITQPIAIADPATGAVVGFKDANNQDQPLPLVTQDVTTPSLTNVPSVSAIQLLGAAQAVMIQSMIVAAINQYAAGLKAPTLSSIAVGAGLDASNVIAIAATATTPAITQSTINAKVLSLGNQTNTAAPTFSGSPSVPTIAVVGGGALVVGAQILITWPTATGASGDTVSNAFQLSHQGPGVPNTPIPGAAGGGPITGATTPYVVAAADFGLNLVATMISTDTVNHSPASVSSVPTAAVGATVPSGTASALTPSGPQLNTVAITAPFPSAVTVPNCTYAGQFYLGGNPISLAGVPGVSRVQTATPLVMLGGLGLVGVLTCDYVLTSPLNISSAPIACSNSVTLTAAVAPTVVVTNISPPSLIGSTAGGGSIQGVLQAAANDTAPAASLPSAVTAPITTFAGTALDLTGYAQTFNDTFATSDVGNDGSGATWIANQFPTFGAIANWQNQGASPNAYPHSTNEQDIVVQKSGGNWTGGIVQSVNSSGVGFSQAGGYFEAELQFTGLVSSWNAFWLLDIGNIQTPTLPHCEIDVTEEYGDGGNVTYFVTLHTYTPGAGTPDQNFAIQINVGSNLSAGKHTYGVLITNTWVIIYFDRVEVCRFAATQVSQKPMYMLLDSTLLETPPSDTTARTMKITAVKVYALTSSTSLSIAYPKAVTSGVFRGVWVNPADPIALTSVIELPNSVAFAQKLGTPGGQSDPDVITQQLQFFTPAAYTNPGASVVVTPSIAKAMIAFFMEDAGIDPIAGLLASALLSSDANPGTATSGVITGITGNVVVYGILATGGGANAGIGSNDGSSALGGSGITAGHHSNVSDGDDCAVFRRTISGVKSTDNIVAMFTMAGFSDWDQFISIWVFRAATAGGMQNQVQETLAYGIAEGVWTVQVGSGPAVVTPPTSEAYNVLRNGAVFGAPIASGVLKTDVLDVANWPVADTLQLSPLTTFAAVPGKTFQIPVASTILYTVAAPPTSFSLTNQGPFVLTSGQKVGPLTAATASGGGALPLTWSEGLTIPGLTINQQAGTLAGTVGTVTQATILQVPITATGSDGVAATVIVQFTINPAQAASNVVLQSSFNAGVLNANQLQNSQVQCLGLYPQIFAIPESGIVGPSVIAALNTNIRFGKVVDPSGQSQRLFYLQAVNSGDPTTANFPRVDWALGNGTLTKGVTYQVAQEFIIPTHTYQSGDNQTITAVHEGPDTGSGNWEYQINNGVFQIAQTNNNGTTWFNVSPQPTPDVPHKYVMKFKLDPTGGNGGFNQCWIDGVLVWNVTGANSVTATGDYCKAGIYAYQMTSGYRHMYHRSYYLAVDQGYTLAQMQALLT